MRDQTDMGVPGSLALRPVAQAPEGRHETPARASPRELPGLLIVAIDLRRKWQFPGELGALPCSRRIGQRPRKEGLKRARRVPRAEVIPTIPGTGSSILRCCSPTAAT